MAIRQNSFAKKQTSKMLRLCRPAADKTEVVKPDILPQESPAHAVLNSKNSAFLAHLEPEI
jgi:hypothetical protein